MEKRVTGFPAMIALLFAAAGLFSGRAGAAALPERFKTALARSLDADASWTMVKTIEDSPLKFRFEGVVSCFKGKGVIWSMEKPIKSKIAMLSEGIEFSGDGKGLRKVPSSEFPHYHEVRQAVDDFLAGGEVPFDRLFEVDSSVADGKWRVEFAPRRFDMRRIIRSVTVTGSEVVEKARFRYASGESADIEFRESGRAAHSLWKGRE